MNIIFYVGVVTIFTFFIRATFRVIKRKWGADVYFHLYYIDEIRKNNHKIPKRLSRTLTSGFCVYPFFVHWYLSFLKREWVEKIEPFFGSIIDTLNNVFLFFVSISFFSSLGLGNNLNAAFITSIIFALTPILVKANARVFSLSARALGQLLFSIVTFFAFQFHWTNNYFHILPCLVVIPFIFLSSKFTTQVVIIFYPILAILSRSIFFFLLIPSGILLAIAISKGLYWRVLRGQFRHLSFYARTIQFKRTRRDPLIKAITALPNLIHAPKKYLKIFYSNPILNMLVHTPFLAVWAINFVYNGNYQEPYFFDLSVWVISALITTVIISIRYLNFLGEPERYMEYAIFPLSILSAYIIVNSKPYTYLAVLALIYSFGVILANYWIGMLPYGDPTQEENVIEYLNSISETENILSIPIYFVRRIAYSTNHNVVMFSGNLASTRKNEEEFNLVFPRRYPCPNRDLSLLIRKYGLDKIVKEKRFPCNDEYDVRRLFKCFENEKYIIYSIKPSEKRKNETSGCFDKTVTS